MIFLWTIFLINMARADEYSGVEYKVTSLGGPLYSLEGAGGNVTALVGPDGTLIVDSDFAEMAPKLSAKLKELGGSDPRFLVNTHFHYDHTGGNLVFGERATILAAGSLRKRLMTEQTLWKKVFPPLPPKAWPTVTTENSLHLHLNGEEIEVAHLPSGHTDGDSVVFFNKVASLGDLYFAGMYPIFHPEHRGNLKGYVRNLKSILERLPADVKIVPGHGPVTGKAELENYYHMILASIERVNAGIRAGKRLEEIQKLGLDPRWEAFSHGYVTTDRWIKMLYENLAQSPKVR